MGLYVFSDFKRFILNFYVLVYSGFISNESVVSISFFLSLGFNVGEDSLKTAEDIAFFPYFPFFAHEI